MRFSIRYALAIITLLAVALASLLRAGPVSSSLWITFSLGALLTSIVLSCIEVGRRRAFWLGFAIFGIGYWSVLLLPLLFSNSSNGNWRQFGSNGLATTFLLDTFYARVVAVFGYTKIERSSSGTYFLPWDYMRIGHSFFAIVFGIVGGAVASITHARRYPESGEGP
jgi:hypothetical protein